MQLEGRITLVLDPQLEPALRLVVVDGVKALKEYRVDHVLALEDSVISTDSDSVLYLCRPIPDQVRLVAAQVKALGRRGGRKVCHCALTPRRTFLAEAVLKEEGVLGAASSSGGSHSDLAGLVHSPGTVSVGEYTGFELLPVDDDLLVLNNDSAIADVAVRGDTGPLYAVTQALLKLQSVFGPFGNLRSKGPMAGAVVELLLRLQAEAQGAARGGQAGAASSAAADGTGAGSGPAGRAAASAAGVASAGEPAHGGGFGAAGGAASSLGFNLAAAVADTRTHVVALGAAAGGGGSDSGGGAASGAPARAGEAAGPAPVRGEIDTCIVLDRLVDWVTPLLTPLTYEALLDESPLGPLRCGMLTVETALIVDPAEREEAAAAAAAAAAGGRKGAPPPPPSPALPALTTLHLNSNAKLYSELRDCNIQKAGPRLAARAREMQALRDSVTKARAADLAVADIRRFVQQIPGLQADMRMLRVLIQLTEPLKRATDAPAFLERWQLERGVLDEDGKAAAYDAVAAAIHRRDPLLPTLRLLCLTAAVEGGLRHKQLDGFRRSLLHSYGFGAVLPCLRALDAACLLREREGAEGLAAAFSSSASAWSSLRKGLGLTADEVDVEEPSDTHFVTSGYAPLSVRLVQAALCLPALPSLGPAGAAAAAPASTKAGASGPGAAGSAAGVSPSFAGTRGWLAPGMVELLKLLPGPVWHVSAAGSGAATGASAGADGAGGDGSGGSTAGGDGSAGVGLETRRTVLVVYVGGVTYLELAALRFIAERAPVDFMVLATCVTSGPKLLRDLTGVADDRPGWAGAVRSGGSTAAAGRR